MNILFLSFIYHTDTIKRKTYTPYLGGLYVNIGETNGVILKSELI